jgi:proton-translocating NADH-quinone oxidoreductase chain M
MVPLHLWLPLAHVEAPTGGSILLAGVLLKLGACGFLRVSLSIFPAATFYFLPFIKAIALFSVVYASWVALRQTDMKRLVAYASIAHMNIAVLGLFTNTKEGVMGAIVIFLAHGFVSSALFFLIGVLYDRHGSRLISYYGGLIQLMPITAFMFLFFSLANISFPLTMNFAGELLVMLSLIYHRMTIFLIAAVASLVLGTAYSMWLYNRIFFGELKTFYGVLYQDLDRRELFILVLLAFATLFFGLCPNLIIGFLDYDVTCIVNRPHLIRLHLINGLFFISENKDVFTFRDFEKLNAVILRSLKVSFKPE